MPKCWVCKKKTLVGVDCVCGHFFCLKHRFPNDSDTTGSHVCGGIAKKINQEKKELEKIINVPPTPKVDII